jgi:hypothetical protein
MLPPMLAAGDGPKTGQTAALLICMLLLLIDDFSVVRISGAESQTNFWMKGNCRTSSFCSCPFPACMHESNFVFESFEG